MSSYQNPQGEREGWAYLETLVALPLLETEQRPKLTRTSGVIELPLECLHAICEVEFRDSVRHPWVSTLLKESRDALPRDHVS